MTIVIPDATIDLLSDHRLWLAMYLTIAFIVFAITARMFFRWVRSTKFCGDVAEDQFCSFWVGLAAASVWPIALVYLITVRIILPREPQKAQ